MGIRPFKAILCLALCLGLAGCGGKTDEPHSPAPLLDFECSAAIGSACTSDKAGSTLIVGMTERLDIDCAFRLSHFSGDGLLAQFDYGSLAVMEDRGTYLLGLTEHWFNFAQAPVISIPRRTMRVCAFVDLNSNGRLDVGEPMH